ncbi:MAG TPA: diguanylate cyclase [Candidatus Paceibacterota bacterium]|nr:diguanylate cyclase [Candidatus Paceibacterota bacterium]
MATKLRITPDEKTALRRALEEEAAAHKETQAAHERSIERQMALERQLADLRETFMETERSFSIMQIQLDSAKKKIARLSKLRREAEARSLRHQFIDIYNLEGFRHEYNRFVRELARGIWNSGTIVYFDLDGFKLVNDLLSHDVGNEILIAFGECLHNESRPEDISACLHGDEFALILPDADRKDAESIMARIHKAAAGINAGDMDYKHIFAELGRTQLVEFSSGYFTMQRGDPILSAEEALMKAEATIPKFFNRRKPRNK